MRKFSAKIAFTALSVLAAFAISVPQAHSQGGAADFIVNCNQGESIQDALDQASDGNRIKVVVGTCSENIVIKLDHLTLFGTGNPTIDGSGDPASDTVRVLGADVTIKGLTITGGRNGIDIRGASSANISECVVTSNGNIGISVTRSSAANINDNTILGNGSDGVVVRSFAHADVKNNTITGNGDDGLHVRFYGFVELDGPNLFQSNTEDGVRCSNHARLEVLAVQNFGSGNGDQNTSIGCFLFNGPPDPEFP